MNQEELKLEMKCREAARRAGWACWKNENNGNKGIPDDSFLNEDGRFLLIEFKKDEKQRLRPEQETWKKRFPNIVFRVSSYSDFCKLLKIKE